MSGLQAAHGGAPAADGEPLRRKAVAVRYRQPAAAGDDGDRAPRVTAKGAGEIADRIIALARAHGIPLHEDRDLVQLLGLLDLDAEIPPNLYRALAEVLAHLYRANARESGAARGGISGGVGSSR